MVHIILLILKIAGIVLLSLLGILILLALMVLFVPVRYNISADYHSRLIAKVKISWLLNALRLKVSYDDNLSAKAYVVFFKIFDNNSDKTKKQKDKVADKYIDDTYEADNTQKNTVQVETLEAEKGTIADKENDLRPRKDNKNNDQHNDDNKHNKYNKQQVSQPHKKENHKGRLKASFNRLKDKLLSIKNSLKKFFKAIADKKRSAEDKINDLKEIINDEENKELVRLVKKELKVLIKEIAPAKYDVNVRYGCEEPYMTGRILGVLAVLYGITGIQFNITPEFEEKVLEGDIYMKGRVRIYRLLLIALRIYKNNRFRQLVFNKG